MKNQKTAALMLSVALLLSGSVALAQGFTTIQSKYGTPTASAQPTNTTTATSGTPTNSSSTTASSSTQSNKTAISATDNSGFITLQGEYDLKELVEMMSKATGTNFILDDKNLRGKITIISEKPLTVKEAYEAFLSSLEVNGLTTVDTPSGLVNIVQKKDSISKPTDLYKYDDDSPNTDKFITRILQVTNISANDLYQVIKPMLSKDGNSFAYPTTNSIIVTDTGSNIDHIMKLAKELDQEGPQEVLDIIPIVNADAKDIASKINEIFADSSSSSSAANSSATSSLARARLLRRSGQQEMEDVQQISKVIADERINSVIIMGTKRAIVRVRALVARLDRTVEGVDGSIHVYYLQHANAKELSEVLGNLVSSSAKPAAATASGANKASAATTKSSNSDSVELEGGVKVTSDDATNSLIITASPKDYTTLVDKVIKKLDIVRPQVYLEAVIMAMNVQKKTTFGVSGLGGLINTTSGGTALTSFGAILPTTPAAISSIAGASGGITGGVVSDKTISFTDSKGNTVSVPAISGIIQALQSDTDVNVLSTPSLMTLDNEEAQLQVGQDVPVPSGTTVSSGITTFNVTREDVGIILKITPQISESENVRLKIAQEISSVFSSDPTLGPTLDTKKVETVVVAKNQQTVVIGGLIDDKSAVSTQKVPLLGDIPVLGTLFRTRSTEKTKTNLIVFITPYIVKGKSDFMAILKKKVDERNAFIDLNYGSGQKKIIRQAIANHASDLLEFKCTLSGLKDPCLSSTSYQNPMGNSFGNTTATQQTGSTSTTASSSSNSYQPQKRVKQRQTSR